MFFRHVVSTTLHIRASTTNSELRAIYWALNVDLENVKVSVLPNKNKWKERIKLSRERWQQQVGNIKMRIIFHS